MGAIVRKAQQHQLETDVKLENTKFAADGGFQVLKRQDLAPRIHLFKVLAPAIARKARAGQFVIIRLDEFGERIPLTLADWSPESGYITIVFMEVGASTMMLSTLDEGDYIKDVVGPLGLPSHIEKFGHIVCVAGGVGVAPITPIARTLKAAGNTVTSIIGGRTRNLVFWEEQLRSFSDRLIITTDDGSYGRKGVVTEPLTELLKSERVDRVVAIGPAIMMKFCAKTTELFGIKTIVSLNPIMVDGTGMCGCCRVSIGGETKFTCVDGPEFEAHLVDWDLLLTRQRTYPEKEAHALKDCKWRAYQNILIASED